MNRICHYILVLFFLSYNSIAYSQGWDMVYDFCTDSIINSTVYSCYADTDRFFVTGATSTYNISPLHGTLAAFDYNKNLLWYKKMIHPGEYNATVWNKSIVKLSDDKFLLLGEVFDHDVNPNISVWYPYFYVFNKDGDSLNYRTFPDSFKMVYYNSAIADNRGFTAVGRSTSKEIVQVGHGYNYSKYYLHVCRFDTALNLVWEKQFMECPIVLAEPNKIICSSDKKYYVISGALADTNQFTENTYFVKLDTLGNLIWAKKLPKKYLSVNYCDIVANPTGGYYFITSHSVDSGLGPGTTSSIYYGKLDEDGDTTWTHVFADSLGYCEGSEIAWSNDGRHLLISGVGNAGTRPTLVKIDTLGNVLWYRRPLHTYNFADPYYIPRQGFNSLSITPDERYLMGGGIEGPLTGIYDTSGTISWMILTDSSGCRYPGDPGCWPASVQHLNAIGIRIYPNPVFDELMVEGVQERTRMLLYDVYGRQVYSGIARSAKETILTNDLPPGNYILQLTDPDGKRSSYKVLKQ